MMCERNDLVELLFHFFCSSLFRPSFLLYRGVASFILALLLTINFCFVLRDKNPTYPLCIKISRAYVSHSVQ